MKYLLLILCFCISFCDIQAQDDDVIQRAKSGDLTLEECLDRRVLEQGFDVFPSLLRLKDALENDASLDCQRYILVVESLCNLYINQGDYYSAKILIGNVYNKISETVSSPNNPYSRQLRIYQGQIELMMNNINEALDYMINDLQMCEEANDYTDTYFILAHNISSTLMKKGDVLRAKLFMDEAIENIEKTYGNKLDNRQEEL